MFQAAFQHFAFCVALLLAPLIGRAADTPAAQTPPPTPARSAPSRPGATANVSSAPSAASLPTKKFSGVDYVNVTDAATRLGLKFAWVKRGKIASLSGTGARAEIEADSRETTINGLRVFLGDKAEDAGGQLYVSRIDFERCLTPLLRPGFGVAAPAPPKIIVLDAGHGGNDPGKINEKLKINEKTFTLDVAQRTKKLLEAAGLRVVLTRDDDVALDPDKQTDLAKRAAVANTSKADLFVSIHFNALDNNTTTSGVEIYTFPPTAQRSTKSWSPGGHNDAEKEPAPGNRFDHWNVALAQTIHRRFVTDLKTFDRGKKLYHLGVLRGLTCPGVLVECGFLTSDVEARKIATAVYRQQVAQTLAAGIRDYATLVGTTSARVAASTK